jgi:hypothetical protein
VFVCYHFVNETLAAKKTEAATMTATTATVTENAGSTAKDDSDSSDGELVTRKAPVRKEGIVRRSYLDDSDSDPSDEESIVKRKPAAKAAAPAQKAAVVSDDSSDDEVVVKAKAPIAKSTAKKSSDSDDSPDEDEDAPQSKSPPVTRAKKADDSGSGSESTDGGQGNEHEVSAAKAAVPAKKDDSDSDSDASEDEKPAKKPTAATKKAKAKSPAASPAKSPGKKGRKTKADDSSDESSDDEPPKSRRSSIKGASSSNGKKGKSKAPPATDESESSYEEEVIEDDDEEEVIEEEVIDENNKANSGQPSTFDAFSGFGTQVQGFPDFGSTSNTGGDMFASFPSNDNTARSKKSGTGFDEDDPFAAGPVEFSTHTRPSPMNQRSRASSSSFKMATDPFSESQVKNFPPQRTISDTNTATLPSVSTPVKPTGAGKSKFVIKNGKLVKDESGDASSVMSATSASKAKFVIKNGKLVRNDSFQSLSRDSIAENSVGQGGKAKFIVKNGKLVKDDSTLLQAPSLSDMLGSQPVKMERRNSLDSKLGDADEDARTNRRSQLTIKSSSRMLLGGTGVKMPRRASGLASGSTPKSNYVIRNGKLVRAESVSEAQADDTFKVATPVAASKSFSSVSVTPAFTIVGGKLVKTGEIAPIDDKKDGGKKRVKKDKDKDKRKDKDVKETKDKDKKRDKETKDKDKKKEKKKEKPKAKV